MIRVLDTLSEVQYIVNINSTFFTFYFHVLSRKFKITHVVHICGSIIFLLGSSAPNPLSHPPTKQPAAWEELSRSHCSGLNFKK